MTSETVDKLHDSDYRKAFVASQINIGIPFQIRALMKARGWRQEQLAQKADMLQPRISGLMTPGKTRPNIDTLRRLAEAFDCGLIVRFAPFSELVRWSREFDPDSFNAPEFAKDTGFVERKAPVQAARSSSVEALIATAGMFGGGINPMKQHRALLGGFERQFLVAGASSESLSKMIQNCAGEPSSGSGIESLLPRQDRRVS
jgi:transcriptional regulator with XRE-family HTH domain